MNYAGEEGITDHNELRQVEPHHNFCSPEKPCMLADKTHRM